MLHNPKCVYMLHNPKSSPLSSITYIQHMNNTVCDPTIPGNAFDIRPRQQQAPPPQQMWSQQEVGTSQQERTEAIPAPVEMEPIASAAILQACS
jgi:hypothetical protein